MNEKEKWIIDVAKRSEELLNSILSCEETLDINIDGYFTSKIKTLLNEVLVPMQEYYSTGNKEARKKKDGIFKELKPLIADKLEIDEDRIKRDSRFREDLGADSLDEYELLYAVDSEMGVSVPEVIASEIKIVEDAISYIYIERTK